MNTRLNAVANACSRPTEPRTEVSDQLSKTLRGHEHQIDQRSQWCFDLTRNRIGHEPGVYGPDIIMRVGRSLTFAALKDEDTLRWWFPRVRSNSSDSNAGLRLPVLRLGNRDRHLEELKPAPISFIWFAIQVHTYNFIDTYDQLSIPDKHPDSGDSNDHRKLAESDHAQ